MRNVYDFDKTLYDGDSTLNFYFFCLRKNLKILKWVPKQCTAFVLYRLGIITKTKMKEMFYVFFKDIDNMDQLVNEFWQVEIKKIAKWYLKQQRSDDVVISASPEFLLKPICTRIGIQHVIASKVDPMNGNYIGENCYGIEKVRRFYQEYPNKKIKSFYSDSYSDKPMAKLAENAYLVRGNHLNKWER